MKPMAIRLTGLSKHFGEVVAVDNVDLEISDGEFFAMLGPSGSGKTTVLRMIAGFETPDSGRIELAGEDVTDQPPFLRDLGVNAWRTFRSVVLPITYPAFIAGAIFTFSLSMGDYITVKIVGGKTQLFANIVYDNIGTAGNLPFAAAAAIWIFDNLFRPNQAPIINVVAACLILAFALPVWSSQRLPDGAAVGGRI